MDAGKFSRYEIREILGKGGMSEVYRAYDPYFDRDVALKILRREMVDDLRLRERFERETKIIAKLELEGIVPVYDIGRENDRLFFVMRLMTGGTLSERMEHGPIPPAEISRIIQRIAPSLDDAHRRGIIHRDLKPGNILFDENNNAFISDFGIAKSIALPSTTTLTDGGVVGTPRYMSPEQARGDAVDARSDIYSLGVIVFEMLIGQSRFDVVTPLGMAFRDESSPAPRITDTDPTFPPVVQTVIDKVLARDRSNRYATTVEFANALAAALAEPRLNPQAHVVVETPAEPKPKAWFTSRMWMVSGIFLLALILFAIRSYSNSIAPTVATSTPTIAVATTTSLPANTQEATATNTALPTETATAPVSVDIGIGGANKIALVANKEIYLLNPDGSSIEPLTQTRVPKFDLQWLPNGRELLYVEGSCVYKIDVESAQRDPEQLICFTDDKFMGFRISPDGKLVAISMAHRLLVLPYDLQSLSTDSSAFALQRLDSLCLDYADVAVKGALWSADGKRLAIRYQSVVNGRIGDTIRVIEGNWDRCQDVPVLPWDEFPADHFVPNGYAKYPLLPSYHWDGEERFLFNTFIRNGNYGDLYLYEMSSESASKINPIEGACCYGSASFSPDGTYILLVFQDVRLGSKSENKLYYIPIDQMGATKFTPLRLPRLFFQNLDENIQLALRPSIP
jgi:serine/threonine-protein kinase